MINYLVVSGGHRVCTDETRLDDCIKEYDNAEVVEVRDCSSVCCDCGWNPNRHYGIATRPIEKTREEFYWD